MRIDRATTIPTVRRRRSSDRAAGRFVERHDRVVVAMVDREELSQIVRSQSRLGPVEALSPRLVAEAGEYLLHSEEVSCLERTQADARTVPQRQARELASRVSRLHAAS